MRPLVAQWESGWRLGVLLGGAVDREAARGPGDHSLGRCCPEGDRVLRNECPLGCRTEVPVASVFLPVKWEQGFPQVLLAQCTMFAVFPVGRWGHPQIKTGSPLPLPALPSQPEMEGPNVGSGSCQARGRRGPLGSHTRAWAGVAQGQVGAGPAVYRHGGSFFQSSRAVPLSWGGLGETTVLSSVIPSLCWCLGPKGWVGLGPAISTPILGPPPWEGRGVSGQTWGCPRRACGPQPPV